MVLHLSSGGENCKHCEVEEGIEVLNISPFSGLATLVFLSAFLQPSSLSHTSRVCTPGPSGPLALVFKGTAG